MNYLELINQVSDRLGWGQADAITDTATAEQRKIIGVANTTLQAMQGDRDWPELRKTHVISIPAYTSEDDVFNTLKGSVNFSVQAGSTTLLYDADVGKIVKGNTHQAYYTIATVIDGDRSGTLDRVWTGTSASLETFTMGNMKFSLPSDYDRHLSGNNLLMDTGAEVSEVSPTEMRKIIREDKQAFRVGYPKNFTIHGLDSSGYPVIHFDSMLDVAVNMEFEYQMKHPEIVMGAGETNSEIRYPDRFGLYIVDQIVAKLMRDVEQGAAMQQNAQDAMKEAIRSNSTPSPSRERTVMTTDALRHGAFRRR